MYFCNIRNNGKFPEKGYPVTRCEKCSFKGIACNPSNDYVGCYSGWCFDDERIGSKEQ